MKQYHNEYKDKILDIIILLWKSWNQDIKSLPDQQQKQPPSSLPTFLILSKLIISILPFMFLENGRKFDHNLLFLWKLLTCGYS